MVVVNADTGQVITTLATGAGTDAAGFDPETGYVFSSNGEGTLTVIHEDSPDKFSVVENVPTQARLSPQNRLAKIPDRGLTRTMYRVAWLIAFVFNQPQSCLRSIAAQACVDIRCRF